MMEGKGQAGPDQQGSTPWWVIAAAASALILSLGGVLYAFLTPVR